MDNLIQLRKDLENIANPEKARHLQRFFKTGKGEYAQGDIFLGVMVPQSRMLAKRYKDLDSKSIQFLIKSKFHEERLIALFILINKYKTTNNQKIIFNFYIKNMKYVNNWDLVDLSAPNVIGMYLLDNNRTILYKLVKSKNFWERRIAVLSTFPFIKNMQFKDALKLAKILLNDKHDLIHKAVGWMLREIGKKDQKLEIKFLDQHYKNMPRTMLRYAIEKFPEKMRKHYMRS